MKLEASHFFVKFAIRAILGMGLIFLLNHFVIPENSALRVGINWISVLASGTLGIPGVGMLYGILIYKIL